MARGGTVACGGPRNWHGRSRVLLWRVQIQGSKVYPLAQSARGAVPFVWPSNWPNKRHVTQGQTFSMLSKKALALAGREVVSYLLARGRGGIGRRVRFRSVWGQPREGSSPFARTTIYQRFCLAQAAFFMSRPHSGSHRQLLPVRATRVRSIQRRALPLLGEGYDVLISVADVRQVVCHSLDHHDAQATDSDFID